MELYRAVRAVNPNIVVVLFMAAISAVRENFLRSRRRARNGCARLEM